ncbi:MBL fold metallo-hydrolase [Thermococcus sp.]|uniref:MBL fold metallo-hydrolase n=1 Tax=Thermococcus sp. TaxID=35749 RepID=UPI00261F0BC2|nr:MBL fold metallo-hydrolase [Thermococcus sp.]
MKVTVVYENHAGFKKGLLGGYGFSALVEHGGTRVLVDTGTDGEVLMKNMRFLGIDLDSIDYIFLTHGHYDHTGGLKTFLQTRSKPVPVVGHPEIFRRRIALKPYHRNIGIPFGRDELEALGAEFILDEKPFQFAPGFWSSGEINRITWDRAVGYVEENGGFVKDTVPDDISLIVDLGDEVAVITGCGHSGVLNIAWHAEDLLGKPVKALIGGLHLIGANERLLEDVVDNTSAATLYAGHCTGIESFAYLHAVLGERMRPLHVGKSFEV